MHKENETYCLQSSLSNIFKCFLYKSFSVTSVQTWLCAVTLANCNNGEGPLGGDRT